MNAFAPLPVRPDPFPHAVAESWLEPDLYAELVATFARHGFAPRRDSIRFVPGLVQDTLHPSSPVALAHIDCDRHDSVLTCLERITPALAEGGMLLVDDYGSRSGCTRAVDDFFRGRRGIRIARGAQLVATRVSSAGPS